MTIDKNTLEGAREWAENLRALHHSLDGLPVDKIDGIYFRALVSAIGAHANMLEALLPTLADMDVSERHDHKWCQCDVKGQHFRQVLISVRDDGADLADMNRLSCSFALAHVTPRPDLPRMVWPDGEQEADDTREPEQAPAHTTELVAEDDYRGAPNGTVVWGSSPEYSSPTSLEKWYDLWHESGVTNSYGEGAMAECGPHQVLRWGGDQ